jgi:putative solute:sodium symporter small subunit
MPQNTSPASNQRRYWRSNLWVVSALLVIWFIFSILLSIVWAEPLNQFHLRGFPLGFWVAQQGAIFVFVILILAYAIIMGKLDRIYRRGGR